MTVKGPAGGFSNAILDVKASPNPKLFKKQGSSFKLHLIKDSDSDFHTDESFEHEL